MTLKMSPRSISWSSCWMVPPCSHTARPMQAQAMSCFFTSRSCPHVLSCLGYLIAMSLCAPTKPGPSSEAQARTAKKEAARRTC